MQQVNPLDDSFVPIAFMVGMALATGVGIVFLSWLLGSRNPSHAGDTIYECGLDPMDEPHVRFSVKFHVVAMLFILFDVEIALLYPWALVIGGAATSPELRLLALFEFLTFLALLVAGYVYLYRAGAFDWARGVAVPREAARRDAQGRAA